MPATFAKDLCGYRAHGKPNTSDASEAFSVELGQALFEVLGVDPGAHGDEPTGGPFADRVAADLRSRAEDAGSSTVVTPEMSLNMFEQYKHVGALRGMKPDASRELRRALDRAYALIRRKIVSPPRDLARAEELILNVETALSEEIERRRLLLEQVGVESLLKLDVTASRYRTPTSDPELLVGLSLKWSLRTDRAQDCRSQGAKMAALRRGPMPHFAAVTMEPRPYMLNLLAGGSGDVDCVYHLDLPALTTAVEAVCAGRPLRRTTLETFRRMVAQRRVQDYDELVARVLQV